MTKEVVMLKFQSQLRCLHKPTCEKQKWQNHDPILGMNKKMDYFRIILGIMFSPARKLYMIEPVNALNKLEISTRVSWYHGGR